MAKGKAAELAAWVARERPAEIGEREWEALRAALGSDLGNIFAQIVAGFGVALAPLIEGFDRRRSRRWSGVS